MIEASKPGKVKVRREPSLRSSWRRQSVGVCADEKSTGSAATAGSLKKAGWGQVATCARVDDLDLRFGTPGRVGRGGRVFFFGVASLGVGCLADGIFFNLD